MTKKYSSVEERNERAARLILEDIKMMKRSHLHISKFDLDGNITEKYQKFLACIHNLFHENALSESSDSIHSSIEDIEATEQLVAQEADNVTVEEDEAPPPYPKIKFDLDRDDPEILLNSWMKKD